MYRIFCESYDNYLKTFNEDNYRLRVAEPLQLITNIDKYRKEKESNSEIYKKLCDLVHFMQENIEKFPKFKAFLWTLNSREIYGKKYDVSKK